MTRSRLVWIIALALVMFPLFPSRAIATADSSYISDGLRFSISWTGSWELIAEQSDVQSEAFTLSNGTSTVRFRALLGFGGDSDLCLDYVETELRADGELAFGDEIGGRGSRSLSGGSAGSDFNLYRLRAPDSTSRSRVLYLDCRTLVPGESVLIGNVVAPSRDWPGERGELRELWQSLEVSPPRLPGKSSGASPLQAAATWFAQDLKAFWTTAFDNAGRTFRQPDYEVFDDATPSQCGQLWPGAAAIYCGFDDGVYLDQRWIALHVLPDFGTVGVAYLMGHETAHSVQFQEGAVSFNRRQELQADCLAGAYMRSLVDANVFSATSIQGLEGLIRQGGDDAIMNLSGSTTYLESHGTGQQRWTLFRRGYETGVAGCGLVLNDEDRR